MDNGTDGHGKNDITVDSDLVIENLVFSREIFAGGQID